MLLEESINFIFLLEADLAIPEYKHERALVADPTILGRIDYLAPLGRPGHQRFEPKSPLKHQYLVVLYVPSVACGH